MREKELDVKRLGVQRNEWNNEGAFLTFLSLNQRRHVSFGAGMFISELNGPGNVPMYSNHLAPKSALPSPPAPIKHWKILTLINNQFAVHGLLDTQFTAPRGTEVLLTWERSLNLARFKRVVLCFQQQAPG